MQQVQQHRKKKGPPAEADGPCLISTVSSSAIETYR